MDNDAWLPSNQVPKSAHPSAMEQAWWEYSNNDNNDTTENGNNNSDTTDNDNNNDQSVSNCDSFLHADNHNNECEYPTIDETKYHAILLHSVSPKILCNVVLYFNCSCLVFY